MLSLSVELFFGSSPQILCVHVASLLPGHVTPAAAVRCGCCRLSDSVKVSHTTSYLLGLYLSHTSVVYRHGSSRNKTDWMSLFYCQAATGYPCLLTWTPLKRQTALSLNEITTLSSGNLLIRCYIWLYWCSIKHLLIPYWYIINNW